MEKPERLLALDVFRGLTIAMMVVVNNPVIWDSLLVSWLGSVSQKDIFKNLGSYTSLKT